ncbi:hypothetical protein [Pontibaca salina]|uniref:Lipoprotein n=1 Tax=Pontibaca salina TaxID=2795731 RepID=A0A934HR62_9RHOB|nr:hypothetical protein [Pontibaca salina]MBI6630227.1 hypothetical protein [Pontibaca salina]
MMRTALIPPLMLMACSPQSATTAFEPEYLRAEATALDGDLVQVDAAMRGARTVADLETYVECALSQYALKQDYGFARHLRTKIKERGGVLSADAVYTISPSLPRGLATIDVKIEAENCAENGIPTV